MKRAYLVIVDVDPELEAILPDDDREKIVISVALTNNRFLHCHSVELAPDSFQPINAKGTPRA
jgi:hypothetical protein